MILADKIIQLRKKNGWSQEELAERLNVSRQAVSKWEMAQTIPDLDRILQMSQLFGVTTDYLLKDEIEEEEFSDTPIPTPVKRVSLEEANCYLAQRDRASVRIALATFLCILAVIPMLLLGGASDLGVWPITEEIAGTVGILTLICIVAAAVAVFLYCGFQNQPYDYLEDGTEFELEYGVHGIVSERQKAFQPTYVKCNIFATCICMLSPLPLILAAFTGREFLTIVMLTVTMLLAGLGVMLFIVAGVRKGATQRLLREGDFTPKKKGRKNRLKEALDTLYWMLLVGGYLCWSFLSGDWHVTWVVFPIGGVINAALNAIFDLVADSKKNNNH